MTIVTLGHSPDADDAFMFYGLTSGKIANPEITFRHVIQDIQSLNQRALEGEFDVTAVSFHAYPYLVDNYVLLPCGASMGDNYGPVLIAREQLAREDIVHARIAIPGTLTSAFLALMLWLERPACELNYIVVPFDQIVGKVIRGESEAGLLIHEAQLTYQDCGLKCIVDLGTWWKQETGLPLPLGGNVIHRRIPKNKRTIIAGLIRESIQYAMRNRTEAIAYAMNFARGTPLELAIKFIGMYVNNFTVDLGNIGRQALEVFFDRAYYAGLIPLLPSIEFD